jgi:hypothetical protein
MGKYRTCFNTLGLSELRRRQRLTAMQIETANRRKNEKALIRLERIDLLLADVVMKKFCNEKK